MVDERVKISKDLFDRGDEGEGLDLYCCYSFFDD